LPLIYFVTRSQLSVKNRFYKRSQQDLCGLHHITTEIKDSLVYRIFTCIYKNQAQKSVCSLQLAKEAQLPQLNFEKLMNLRPTEAAFLNFEKFMTTTVIPETTPSLEAAPAPGR
jgi:hypothetical protein